MAVKVIYSDIDNKINAYLGGELFLDGVKIFEDDKEGIEFANRYYKRYEVIEKVDEVKPYSEVIEIKIDEAKPKITKKSTTKKKG
jgi:hypothetical protein